MKHVRIKKIVKETCKHKWSLEPAFAPDLVCVNCALICKHSFYTFEGKNKEGHSLHECAMCHNYWRWTDDQGNLVDFEFKEW